MDKNSHAGREESDITTLGAIAAALGTFRSSWRGQAGEAVKWRGPGTRLLRRTSELVLTCCTLSIVPRVQVSISSYSVLNVIGIDRYRQDIVHSHTLYCVVTVYSVGTLGR